MRAGPLPFKCSFVRSIVTESQQPACRDKLVAFPGRSGDLLLDSGLQLSAPYDDERLIPGSPDTWCGGPRRARCRPRPDNS
jgi:hypothetical protein